MNQPTSIKQYRQRAIDLLTEEYGNTSYAPIDYTIDDECRRELNLPPRPSNTPPYKTWMVGSKSKIESKRQISDNGIGFIKQWEGLRLRAYQCSAKVWTIGYGHTSGVKPGDVITKHQARELLKQDLVEFEKGVLQAVEVPLTQNQYDALVSLAFNIGVNAFSKSTLVKLLNRKDYQGAANQFPRWCRARGKVIAGLQARREKERELFLK